MIPHMVWFVNPPVWAQPPKGAAHNNRCRSCGGGACQDEAARAHQDAVEIPVHFRQPPCTLPFEPRREPECPGLGRQVNHAGRLGGPVPSEHIHGRANDLATSVVTAVFLQNPPRFR